MAVDDEMAQNNGGKYKVDAHVGRDKQWQGRPVPFQGCVTALSRLPTEIRHAPVCNCIV